MRIVGGEFKGRRLQPPSNIKARPTTDMAREGLFNVLQHHIQFKGITVLDLFFGTGAVSLEFLSRGAGAVTAVDIDIVSRQFLHKIKEDWDLTNLKIVKADVFRLVSKPKGKFDLVFADPPYVDPRFPEFPTQVMETGWLNEGGIFILEHNWEHDYSQHHRFFLHKNFGNVNFSFFR